MFISLYYKMNTEEIYNKVRSIDNMGARKEYLKTLTPEEKKAYDRFRQKINAKNFNDKPENKEKYNEMRRKRIKDERKLHPEHYQEQNIKDLKTYRNKRKEKKALSIISNAIRAKKARQELKRLKDIKEKVSNLESILSNLRLELKK